MVACIVCCCRWLRVYLPQKERETCFCASAASVSKNIRSSHTKEFHYRNLWNFHILRNERILTNNFVEWKLRILRSHFFRNLRSLVKFTTVIQKKIFKDIMHIHNMTKLATPSHRNPCPGGHGIYNFGKLSWSLLLYVQFVWNMPRSREEDFQRFNAFSLYDKSSHTQHRSPYPGGHEIFWYRLPSSSFLYIQFVWNMPRRIEEDFSKIASILQFLPQN